MEEPQKSKDMLVTMENLILHRREFKSDISVLRNEMKAGFKSIEARFNGVDSKFNGIDSKFKNVDLRFDKIDAKFHQLTAEIAQMRSESSRTLALVEEGRVENRYLIDALSFMWKDIDSFKKDQAKRIPIDEG